MNPYVPTSNPSSSSGRNRLQSDEDDEELKRVLQMSLEETDEPINVRINLKTLQTGLS